jgi:two-component system phosphate regulon sensor histidine kinase PhoR
MTLLVAHAQALTRRAIWPVLLGTAAAGAWTLPALLPQDALGRGLAALAAMGLAAVAYAAGRWQAMAREAALRHALAPLGTLDASGLASWAPSLPATAAGAWQPLTDALRQRMLELAQRAETLEMQRAAAEVRLRRLSAQRHQLEEILAGLGDPVLAVDAFGQIVMANPSARKLLGLPATSDGSLPLERLERCETLVGMLSETRRRRVPAQRTAELALPDEEGRTHWYRLCCRPLASLQDGEEVEHDSPHGAVAVLTDITSQKAIQKRNAEFVSAVSHEMKTPLSSIRAYAELLVEGEADDAATREEFLQVIHSQAERLQRLIDNLLNLARIEAGVVAVNKAPLSLNDLLSEAVHVMQPPAEQKRITLTSDFSPLYLGVLADRDMLLQAAINLISNAVKYTPAGGQVTVRSRLSDEEVVLEVQDTGVGLSPEDCQRVFEKFYRVKKDRDMAPGTGLGLALVKHIVEDVHGGRIEVSSQLGQGSTFRILLPGLRQLGG